MARHNIDPPPSLWPARHGRRDAAIARDRARVEDRFASLDRTLAVLSTKVDRLFEVWSQRNNAKTEHCCSFDSLATRIERIEILLMRTSLTDFKTLDTEIQAMLPKLQDRHSQPDPEASPEKHHTAGSFNQLRPVELFEIYSEAGETDTQ